MDYEQAVIDFPVARERSGVEGLILAEEPETIYWSIDIRCEETFIPECYPNEDGGAEDGGYTASCHLEISGLVIPVAGWRDLAGQRIDVAYEASHVHPILPDNPGNFLFAGQHHVPNHNRIAFGERDGCRFGLTWSCVAEGYADETGTRIDVRTRLPLRRFAVYFHEPAVASVQQALPIVIRFADAGDLGPPDTSREQWVSFPLRPDVE